MCGVGIGLACDEAGGVIGAVASRIGAGAARRDWSERHVVKMLPIACCVESCGGLAGGEAKSAACRRVSGGCDESHEMADGRSIFCLAV